jgi:hypothetical protein
MSRGLRSVASLINGFNAGYETVGKVARDSDIAKIMADKPVTTETLQEDAAGNIVATPTTKFLGKDYAAAPDDAAMTKARQLAMAGVLEKHGDVMGGQALRERLLNTDLLQERAARERDLAPLQKRQVELGISAGERNDRMGARSEKMAGETDALNADVGGWLQGRLKNPDGSMRQATIDDHMAASQYRIVKLVQAGKPEEAGAALREYQAAAQGKILMETAQRDQALATTISAAASGDLGAVQDFYNRFVPDGAKVSGVTRGKDGSIAVQRVGEDGSALPPQTLKNTDQLVATLATFKDPMALYKWSQGEFQNRLALNQDSRAQAQLGLSQAASGRAAAEFAAGDSERKARAAAADLRLELAKIDETTPEGRKRADQIESKLQALATGQKGARAGAGADPAAVATARTLVAAGAYPDLATALEGVVNKPDQTHKAFVEKGMANMMKPAEAVKAADEAMSAMGWQRNGSRWTKAGGQAAPTGAPQKGTVVDGFVFQGGDPNDQKNWKKQ